MPYGQVVADTHIDSYNATLAPISVPFRNRIINGAMQIDQRNAGASVTITNTGAATYTLDRWSTYGSVASKFSIQQNAASVTPPVGFKNYLGATSLSAYSIGATDQFLISQAIEGLNVSDLAWGTANASAVTLSFRVYSSLTGTFGGALQNSGQSRCYPFSFSIPVANTWTTISITVAGDTTGTWLTTNGVGLNVVFSLGTGSTYSGTAGSWAGSLYTSATGATSVVGTSGATFYITGVQLEKGSNATSFDYRPYGTELSLCQRYYQRSYYAPGIANAYGGVAWGYIQAQNGNWIGGSVFTLPMRANPTFRNSGFAGTIGTVGRASTGTDATTSTSASFNGIVSGFTLAGFTANESIMLLWDASAEL